MNNEQKQKIKQICTYHGEDGTSGYLLSEEQFEKVFEVIDQAVKEKRSQVGEALCQLHAICDGNPDLKETLSVIYNLKN